MIGVVPFPNPVMFPDPSEPLQAKVVPAQVAVRFMFVVLSEQPEVCMGAFDTLGTGFTMILKSVTGPGQLLAIGAM